MKNKTRLGKIIMALGGLLIASSLILAAYNSIAEYKAYKFSLEALSKLDTAVPEAEQELPDYVINPHMPMPVKEIDGKEYVGTISIPALKLSLPVMKSWSYANFRISPCVYQGSVYLDNMIVAAHNYNKHFGSLKNLKKGDKITFKDMKGNVFSYKVAYTQLLGRYDTKLLNEGQWDLTLFTCTYGGAQRVTVRCKRIIG